MPGLAADVAVTVDYMATPRMDGGTWLPFNPVGACVEEVEIVDGRASAGAGVTVAGRYVVRWSVDSASAFSAFDVLREGRPFRVTFTHPTAGATRFVGWVDTPPVDNYEQRSVQITATDGIGRLQRFYYPDYVAGAMQERGDMTGFWRLDDAEFNTAKASLGPNGSWRFGVAAYQTDPLRIGASGAVQCVAVGTQLGAGLPNFGLAQYAAMPVFSDSADPCTLAVSFKLSVASQPPGTQHPIAGFVEPLGIDVYIPPQSKGPAITVEGTTIRLKGPNGTVAAFSAVVDRVYTAAITYDPIPSGYDIRVYCIDENGTVVSNLTSSGVGAPGGIVGQLAVGPFDGVAQDLTASTTTALGTATSADLVQLAKTVQGWPNSTISQQFSQVMALTDVPIDTPPTGTETVTSSITSVAPVASWARAAEASESGAVYWREGLLRFKKDSDLALSGGFVFANDGTGIQHRAGSRQWTEVYNRAIVSSPDGSEIEFRDDDSILEFGIKPITVNVLNDFGGTVAYQLVARHARPRRQIPELAHSYSATSDTNPTWSIGLFDRVSVVWGDGSTHGFHVVGRRVNYRQGNDLVTRLALADLNDQSGAAAPVLLAGSPAITGTTTPGGTLTVLDVGTWSDYDSILVWWQYSTDGGATWDAISGVGPATSITIPQGLDWAGRQIRAVVVATNEVGSTSFNTPAVGPVVTTPAQVGNVVTNNDIAVAGSFLVSWSAPYDGGSAITQYTVHVSANTSFDPLAGTIVVPPAQLSSIVDSLTPGALYYVRVAAHNSAGRGTWSEAAAVYTSGTAGPITVPLTGTATVGVATSGPLTTTRKIAGTASVDVAASGAFSQTHQIAGTAAATVTASGSLEGIVQLGGTAAVDIAASAILTRERALVGTAAATVTASGTVTDGPAAGSGLVTEAGDQIVTEAGDSIVWE
jgi:hypothetical protein